MGNPRLDECELALTRLERGWRPGKAELKDAPVLECWTLAPGERGTVVLRGLVTNHATLPGTRRAIETSPMLAYDAESGWARTISRWYNLGAPSPLMQAVLARAQPPAPEPRP